MLYLEDFLKPLVLIHLIVINNINITEIISKELIKQVEYK